jgi:hypothetical protein
MFKGSLMVSGTHRMGSVVDSGSSYTHNLPMMTATSPTPYSPYTDNTHPPGVVVLRFRMHTRIMMLIRKLLTRTVVYFLRYEGRDRVVMKKRLDECECVYTYRSIPITSKDTLCFFPLSLGI